MAICRLPFQPRAESIAGAEDSSAARKAIWSPIRLVVAERGETRKLMLASDLDKERKLDLLHSLASREAFEAALAEMPELTTKGERA